MDTTLIQIVCIILLVLGMIGTFLPVLPGLLLSLAGVLIYKFGTDAPLSMIYVWIFVFLTAMSVVLNYVIPARTNRKYGGTRWGSVGSVVGTIGGLLFIPIPFGFLIGMFLGVFIGELLHDASDKKKFRIDYGVKIKAITNERYLQYADELQGNIILSIDNVKATNVETVSKIMKNKEEQQSIRIEMINRNGEIFRIII